MLLAKKEYLQATDKRLQAMAKKLNNVQKEMIDAAMFVIAEDDEVVDVTRTFVNKKQITDTLEKIKDRKFRVNYIADKGDKVWVDEDRNDTLLYQLIDLIDIGHLASYEKVRFLNGGQAHILKLQFEDFSKTYEVQEVLNNDN